MAVQLKPDVQELLLEELKAFAASIPDQERPAGFGALQGAVEQGELPNSLLGPVGNLLEVGLQTGRIRQFHRAPGEQALLRLFAQTPNGQAHARAVAEVNSALERLAGQEVESLRVVMRVPGYLPAADRHGRLRDHLALHPGWRRGGERGRRSVRAWARRLIP